MFVDLEIRLFEFVNIRGTVTVFRGCSVEGCIEFSHRLIEIDNYLKSFDEDISENALYITDAKFRHLINRCLELNGISANDVNWALLRKLLFSYYDEDGNITAPLLIPINELPTSIGTGKPQNYAEMVANIAEREGMIDAIRILNEYPAHTVISVQNAIAENNKSPEQAESDNMQKFKKELIERSQAVDQESYFTE